MLGKVSRDIFGRPLPDDFDCVIEGASRTEGAVIEITRFHWQRPQQGNVSSPWMFLDLSLPSNGLRATGRFLSADGPGEQRCGPLIAVPPHHTLVGSWNAGKKRSISCLLDLDLLAGAGEAIWQEARLLTALDVRSRFMREALARLAHEILAPGIASQTMIDALCRALAVEVRNYFNPRAQPAMPKPARKLGREALCRVQDRVSQPGLPPPAIAELAALCALGPRSFMQIFRHTTGETVAGYVASQRLQIAQNALMVPGASIKQVAYQAGFKTASAFAAAFRRETGSTPSEYRNAAGPHPMASMRPRHEL